MASGILQFAYLAAAILFFVSYTAAARLWGRLAWFSAAATVLSHAAFLIQRSVEANRPPLTNMFETLHLLAFGVTLSLFFLARFQNQAIRLVGGFATLGSAVLVAAGALVSPEIEPLLPVLKSNWLLFHVSACFIGYSALGAATVAALALLIAGPESIRWLDRTTWRLILFGYPFLTLGIATGSVWAELSWGRYWNWDPKETWAFASWLMYSGYLHLRYIKGLRPRLLAAVTVACFLFVLFTYFGVNLWLATLHDYA